MLFVPRCLWWTILALATFHLEGSLPRIWYQVWYAEAEDGEFEANLGYLVELSQNEKQKRDKEKKSPKITPGQTWRELCKHRIVTTCRDWPEGSEGTREWDWRSHQPFILSHANKAWPMATTDWNYTEKSFSLRTVKQEVSPSSLGTVTASDRQLEILWHFRVTRRVHKCGPCNGVVCGPRASSSISDEQPEPEPRARDPCWVLLHFPLLTCINGFIKQKQQGVWELVFVSFLAQKKYIFCFRTPVWLPCALSLFQPSYSPRFA